MNLDTRKYLKGRGLTDKVVQRYKLDAGTYDNRPTLTYPTISMAGKSAMRHKFIDGQKPKNKWHGKTDQSQFRYYSPGGLGKAIEECSGVLYWLSGEPDVWTLYEVLNVECATCTFGEGSIPDTVADDLKSLGVRVVRMYPDLDEPGMRAAYKLAQALEGSGIDLEVYRLPGDMGSKRDLNQLWQDIGFDYRAFTLPTTNITAELAMYGDAPSTSQPALDFKKLYTDWIDVVIAGLGPHHMREGRTLRWHCPLPGHRDEHPSFRVADGSPAMPMCTCGIQDKEATDAWNDVAQALGLDTWEEYKTRCIAEAGILKPVQPNTNPDAPTPDASEAKTDEPLWVDSHQVYSEILDHLEGKNLPDVEYIENPLRILHRFGGFAEIMFPGKLVYIVGISGGGKTSLAETVAESFNKQGYDLVWYGPEWSPYEMGLRALQRAGGLDTIHMAKGVMWDVQGQRGVPEDKRRGVALTDREREDSSRRLYSMAAWPGKTYFLTSRVNRMDLTDMLNMVRALVNDRRKSGRKVVAFFFDYLQRARKSGRDGAFWSEAVIDEIKSLCEELQIIGYVIVQPRKDDSQATRDGKELSEASGQGISDQQCNLYLAIQPIFDMGTRTNYGKIKVVKNSMGQLGEVVVPTQFTRLTWADSEAKGVEVDLGR